MNPIPRREFIKISGTIGAGLAAGPLANSAMAQTAPPSRRPNILVFLTDDHARWAQHAYGNSELWTPNLDRLAAQGTRMTRAFTTCPVCSPARASFFTGRMPSQHGIQDYLGTKDSVVTNYLAGQTLISELLKPAGYRTGLVGKWHCGCDREPKPGFDRWFSYWKNQYPHLGEQHFSDQGKLAVENGQQSPFLTRQAVNFIRDHRQKEGVDGNPFFLFISYTDTHSPHNQAPPELVRRYESATFRDIPNETFSSCHIQAVHPLTETAEQQRHKHMQYYAAVSFLDQQVGEVLAELQSSGLMDNTLVVYTSDHGLNCGQHGIWEKGEATIPQNFLEESVAIACTLSWPAGGIRQNATCDDFVNHCDLWATLLEIAGAVPAASAAAQINSPGISYLNQLRGQTIQGWRQTIFSEYGNARMARNDRYKLINRYPYGGVRFPDELYDLQEDPRETVNRCDDPVLKQVVSDLSAQLDNFFAKYTVPGHDGVDLQHQPIFAGNSCWLRAQQEYGGTVNAFHPRNTGLENQNERTAEEPKEN